MTKILNFLLSKCHSGQSKPLGQKQWGHNPLRHPLNISQKQEQVLPEEEKQLPTVNVERLDGNITMLKTYLDAEDINPLLIALEGLKQESESEAAMQKVMNVLNELGIMAGAVLNYATYLKVLLPLIKDSLGDNSPA
jgi:hypothetical protein